MYYLVRMASAACVLAAACIAQISPRAAQGAITSAGSGYRVQGPAVLAAPGQLLIVSVYGIKTAIPVPISAIAGNSGWPKSISGVSVDLVQGATVTPLELRGIQQGECAVSEACSTVTSVTLQIPFSFVLNSVPFSYLRFNENGSSAGAVMLSAVRDRIHVLNTCDSTLIAVGGSSSVSAENCTPAVMVNAKLNSLYNLIRGGDTVMMWAYGLGEYRSAGNAGVISLNPVITPMLLSFDFRPNAEPSRGDARYGQTAEPLYAGHVSSGTYQVNYTIPPVPAGLPPCDGVNIKSNLTVTLTGFNSFDGAQLCVQP